MKTLAERFDDKFLPEPNTGCWLWTGAVGTNGYGALWHNDVRLLAHRVSWELEHGAHPGPLHVLHRCDMRVCVNPGHLFIGTTQDNHADMMKKGRHVPGSSPGEKNPKARLTAADVVAIRASTEAPAALAKRYGVHHNTIYLILNRRNWSHVA